MFHIVTSSEPLLYLQPDGSLGLRDTAFAVPEWALDELILAVCRTFPGQPFTFEEVQP